MKHRLGALLLIGTSASLFMLVDGHHQATSVVAQSATEGCPETSASDVQTGAILQQFAQDSNSGIIYDSSVAALKLRKEGGLFQSTNFSLASDAHGICTADFDNDGWVDIISTSYYGSEILFSKNLTYENQALNPPNWDDPNYVTTPKFTPAYYIAEDCDGKNGHPDPPYCGGSGNEALSCGDFNGDGNADFMYVRQRNSKSPSGVPHNATMYLGDGTGQFALGYEAAPASDFGYIVKSTTMLPIDYNHDGHLDLVVGGASAYKVESKGQVLLFLSDGDGAAPHFVKQPPLVSNADMGRNGVNTLAYADFNGDGADDLVITSTHRKKILMYPGLAIGGLDPNPVDITGDYPGAAAMVLAADFSLDGHTDMVLAADGYGYGYHLGGTTHYYKSNGSFTPFSGGITQVLTTYNNPDRDFDMAVVFQYDNDPDGTPDMIVANGNNSNSNRVFANRTLTQYTQCGDVVSGVLDLGALAGEEMVVTAARLEPTMSLPAGTSVTFFMSNETPENWQLATPCVDDPAAYCTSFPKPVGRTVKWKATMCSNAAKTQTPTISGVDVTFDYTKAEEHYRAGVVVDDGVAYVGAFRQPGNRGHFYALSAGLGQTYWDFSDSLNAMADSDRNVYTSDVLGTTRLDFAVSSAATSALQATIGVVSTAQATDIVNWQRSARFGIGGSSRLGSVENSTPAVVRPPGLPIWYPRADQDTRELMDTFIAEHADRQTIVLVGSKDGSLHAVRNTPTDISNPLNGTEAWAYVPAKVAASMVEDYTNNTATAYPDGSPTVADVILDDGEIHTVAIISGGNGHKSIFALDVTETIDEDTGTVLGPQPLWHIVPGGSLAGQALSKPVVARVSIAGADKFYAIMATGVAPTNPVAPFSKGRDVVAVDMTTGAIVWQFQSKCPVTSDIVIYETDDELEPGSPSFDGFIDRAAWADSCGNVYKVDPAQSVGASYITGIGSIPTGHIDPDGNAIDALFSTTSTACALGAERPIVGTLGARSDATNRFALFFGTGGIESFDPSLNNDFYAVYSDTGEIRGCAAGAPENGRIQGACTAGVCEKFYGGVVVTESNVIVTRATDPPVGTGVCEFGTSEVTGFAIADFNVAFSVSTNSATVSSLYGAGGAIYFATLSGDIVKIGTARAPNAGDDSANGTGGGQADTGGGSGSGGGMGILGWRVLQ